MAAASEGHASQPVPRGQSADAGPGPAPVEGGRAALLTALVEIGLLSDELTRLAAGMLGPRTTSNSHIQILRMVQRRPGLTPSQVADTLGVRRSAASRLLRRLEREDLLRRRPEPTDRRVMRLETTALGQERASAFSEAVQSAVGASVGRCRQISRTLFAVSGGAPGPTEQAPETDLVTVLARAGAVFLADLEPLLPELGVALLTDRVALSIVRQRGPLRPSALADALGLGSSGTTSVIRRLVRAGLVERRPDPADGRAALVRCTPRGAEVVDVLLELLERHARPMAEAFAQAVDVAAPADRATAATPDPGSGVA